MSFSKYCIDQQTVDGRLGACYYDADGNWTFIEMGDTKPLSNDFKFEYTLNGQVIPNVQRKTVRNNVKTVNIVPGSTTTFYSNLQCTQIIQTLDDVYGEMDVPPGTMCIGVSNKNIPVEPDNQSDVVSSSSGLLWLQIIGWILIALALILVAIAYYQWWRRSTKVPSPTSETMSKTPVSEPTTETFPESPTTPTTIVYEKEILTNGELACKTCTLVSEPSEFRKNVESIKNIVSQELPTSKSNSVHLNKVQMSVPKIASVVNTGVVELPTTF